MFSSYPSIFITPAPSPAGSRSSSPNRHNRHKPLHFEPDENLFGRVIGFVTTGYINAPHFWIHETGQNLVTLVDIDNSAYHATDHKSLIAALKFIYSFGARTDSQYLKFAIGI